MFLPHVSRHPPCFRLRPSCDFQAQGRRPHRAEVWGGVNTTSPTSPLQERKHKTKGNMGMSENGVYPQL